MKAIFEKSIISGSVKAPPSKSVAHRLLICAAMAKGTSVIQGVEYSEDFNATCDCLTALGARTEKNKDSVTIDGTDFPNDTDTECNCRESGSTIRFLIPVAMLKTKKNTLLRKRETFAKTA